MPIQLDINVDGADKLIAKMEGARAVWDVESRKAMVLSQHVIEAEAKAVVPRVTGRLMASIGPNEVKKIGPVLVGQVGTSVHYAPFVEYGRGPIVATHAKTLRFVIGGKVIFRKRVGPARARPYMRPALEGSRAAIHGLFDRAMKNLGDWIAR